MSGARTGPEARWHALRLRRRLIGASMLIAVPAETDPAETRVAATPETVKKLAGLGAELRVETGAGRNSGIPDAEYAVAGATIAPSARETYAGAHIVLKVRRPNADETALLKRGALVIAIMDPY